MVIEGTNYRKEPEPPAEVASGATRMRLGETAVVNYEIVDTIIEEEFTSAEQEDMIRELREKLESLGLDPEQADAIVLAKTNACTTTKAAQPYQVLPQREWETRKKGLNDQVKAAAAKLLDETPETVIAPLLAKIVNERSYESRHRAYVVALWLRLLEVERAAFFSHLSVELEKELPKGRWSPLLRMLTAFEYEGWRAMPARFRKVLETTLIKDVLEGRFDPKRKNSWDSSGAKGTYCRALWPYFSKRYEFAENVIGMLQRSTDTQHYIGEYFVTILEKLAESTNTTDRMIRALKSAVDNGAATVIESLSDLPDEWVKKIAPDKP